MSYLAEYKKSDFKKVIWEKYGKTLEILFNKVKRYIKKNDIKIDAVVPILRGGSFSGTYLTFKLDLLRILPIKTNFCRCLAPTVTADKPLFGLRISKF